MSGPNRKDQLKALFGAPEQKSMPASPQPAEKKPEATPAAIEAPMRPRSASGAVKAMGLSLGGLSRELEEVRRQKDDTSDRILELDTSLVDMSFVTDRLSRNDIRDTEFQELVKSIEENGQQVPILVRPHPDKQGRYQTAYGHRRLQAARHLGRPVSALVRDLSDVQLVLAQGKENTERRDLSFIERALFANALIERGFERGVVQNALSLHKAEMTRFLQVAEAIPVQIANAIGPAPKIGRPRWMALAEVIKGEAAMVKADDEVTSQRFRQADTNTRFNMLFERLSRRTEKKRRDTQISNEQGRPVAQIAAAKGRFSIQFLEKMPDEFDAFLRKEVPSLIEKFEKNKPAEG
jgi:ParB family chromosome partitioning protein